MDPPDGRSRALTEHSEAPIAAVDDGGGGGSWQGGSRKKPDNTAQGQSSPAAGSADFFRRGIRTRPSLMPEPKMSSRLAGPVGGARRGAGAGAGAGAGRTGVSSTGATGADSIAGTSAVGAGSWMTSGGGGIVGPVPVERTTRADMRARPERRAGRGIGGRRSGPGGAPGPGGPGSDGAELGLATGLAPVTRARSGRTGSGTAGTPGAGLGAERGWVGALRAAATGGASNMDAAAGGGVGLGGALGLGAERRHFASGSLCFFAFDSFGRRCGAGSRRFSPRRRATGPSAMGSGSRPPPGAHGSASPNFL